jgi:hypothetical protein
MVPGLGLRAYTLSHDTSPLVFFFCVCVCVCVCVVLELELRAYTLKLHQPLFVKGFFQDRVLQTVCTGWLWTTILLISTSWIARITGLSHWCPAHQPFFVVGFLEIGSQKLFAWIGFEQWSSWSASWVARIMFWATSTQLVLGFFELTIFCLLVRYSTDAPSPFFFFSYFPDRVSCFSSGQASDPYPHTYIDVCHNTQPWEGFL